MIENLEKLVRDHSQSAIVENKEIPNEKNEAAIQAASSSIVETLNQKISSGDLSSIAGMFKENGAQGQAVVHDVESNYANKLQGLGINMNSAKSIAASLIPIVIAHFTKKTNDPNDKSFDLQDIVKSISGPDGKFQLSDLTNLMGNSDNRQPGDTSKGGGGLMDNLRGMFK